MADTGAIALAKGQEAPKPIRTRSVPYEVTFYASRCDDLWDREGKSQIDPFIKILNQKGELLKTTEVIDDTCNPTWAIDKSSVKVTVMPDDPGYISFEVWNWNRFSNDFLGVHRYPITEVFSRGNGEFAFPLCPRLKEPDPEVTKQALGAGLGTITVTTTVIEAPPVVMAPAGTAEATNALKQKYDVSFYIAGCFGLLDREGKGGKDVSDPFIKIIGPGGEKWFETEPRDDTLDPTWPPDEATFKTKLCPTGTGVIEFQAWDHNRVFRNTFLGSVRLTEADVFSQESGVRLLKFGPREKETEVEIKQAPDLGKLKLVITVPEGLTPGGSGATRGTSAAGGVLAEVEPVDVALTVVSCEQLFDRDSFGSGVSDPYVKVCDERGQVVHTTETIENNLNPRWPEGKETVRLLVTPGGAALGKRKVRLEVWDYNSITSHSFLGCVDLDGDELIAKGSGTHRFPLAPRPKEADTTLLEKASKGGLGFITVALKVTPPKPPPSTPAPLSTTGATANAAPPSSQPQPPPSATGAKQPTPAPAAAQAQSPSVQAPVEVTVCVLRCANLMNRDGFGTGESDPYVKVCDEEGAVKHTTEVIHDNLNPTWPEGKESVRLSVTPGGAAAGKRKLRFEVWDWNRVQSHAFLGCAEFDGDELLAKGTGEHTVELQPRPKETDNDVAAYAKGKGLGKLTFQLKVPTPSQPKPPIAQPVNQPASQPIATPPPPATAQLSTPPAADRSPPPLQPQAPSSTSAAKPAEQLRPPPPQPQPVAPVASAPPAPTPAPPAAPPPPPPPPKPVQVRLTIKRATGLLDRDGNSFGSKVSDPYVIVSQNGKTILETPSIDDDLNPVWNKKNATGSIVIQPTEQGAFRFMVMDKNKMSKDTFLGQVDLSFDALRAIGEGVQDFSLPLAARPNEPDSEVLRAPSLGVLEVSAFVTAA